jgi:hypothetical protein
MKKSKINLLGMEPQAKALFQKIQWNKAYLVEKSSLWPRGSKIRNDPTGYVIWVTHFYKEGIRYKILSRPNGGVGVSPFYAFFKQLIEKLNIGTMYYDKLIGYKFTEVPPSQLPTYIDGATKFFEEYFRKVPQS